MELYEHDAEAIATGAPEISNFRYIAISDLRPFHDHVFQFYHGGKLTNLSDSIREHGVIHPIVVRPTKDSGIFEIINGHNRVEAAKLAGLSEVPAIVRDLSDDEAIFVANESNISQRDFYSWRHSERARSIRQYHNTLKQQGSRSDLSAATSGEVHQKSGDGYARQKVALIYNKSAHTIRLYLELSNLITPLMERLDANDFGTSSAQNLSYISEAGQTLIESVLAEESDICKITVTNAKKCGRIKGL